MADGMNKVILLGNVGADPELRYTNAGQGVLNIRLATTESWLDKDKNKMERTSWHSVTVWGKRGEALEKHISKGQLLLIEGRIDYQEYEDREGHKKYRTNIVANDIKLCGGPRRDDAGGSTTSARPARQQNSAGRDARVGGGQDAAAEGAPTDDDIPF